MDDNGSMPENPNSNSQDFPTSNETQSIENSEVITTETEIPVEEVPSEENPAEQRKVIYIGESLKSAFHAVDQAYEKAAGKTIDTISKYSKKALKVGMMGATVYGAIKLPGAIAKAGQQAYSYASEVAQNVIPQVQPTTKTPLIPQTAQAAESTSHVIQQGFQQGLEVARNTSADVMNNAAPLIQQGAEMTQQATPYLVKGAEAAGIAAIGIEAGLLTMETLKGARTAMEKAGGKASQEVATTMINVIENGVPSIANELVGELSLMTQEILNKPGVAKLLDYQKRKGQEAVDTFFGISSAALDTGSKIAKAISNKTGEFTRKFKPFEDQDSVLIKLSKVFEENGNHWLAENIATLETMVKFGSDVEVLARSVSEKAALEATKHRDVANTLDAIIQGVTEQLPAEVNGNLKAYGQKLLQVSERNRTAFSENLSAQYNQARAKNGVKLAQKALLDIGHDIVNQYTSKSPIIRIGNIVIKGIGNAAKSTYTSAVNTGRASVQLVQQGAQAIQQGAQAAKDAGVQSSEAIKQAINNLPQFKL